VLGCGLRVGWNRRGHDESCPYTERNARSGRGKPRPYSRRNTNSGHGVPCPNKSSRGRENQIPCCARNDNAEIFARCGERLFGGGKGKEVLGAFYWFLEAAEELLKVLAALDEIDVGGVDDEEVGRGVAEEEVFVSRSDFFDVFGGDLGFVAGGFFGDAGAEDFRLGLEIDD